MTWLNSSTFQGGIPDLRRIIEQLLRRDMELLRKIEQLVDFAGDYTSLFSRPEDELPSMDIALELLLGKSKAQLDSWTSDVTHDAFMTLGLSFKTHKNGLGFIQNASARLATVLWHSKNATNERDFVACFIREFKQTFPDIVPDSFSRYENYIEQEVDREEGNQKENSKDQVPVSGSIGGNLH